MAMIRLIRVGPARTLTQGMLPFGMLESEDPTNCWGV